MQSDDVIRKRCCMDSMPFCVCVWRVLWSAPQETKEQNGMESMQLCEIITRNEKATVMKKNPCAHCAACYSAAQWLAVVVG